MRCGHEIGAETGASERAHLVELEHALRVLAQQHAAEPSAHDPVLAHHDGGLAGLVSEVAAHRDAVGGQRDQQPHCRVPMGKSARRHESTSPSYDVKPRSRRTCGYRMWLQNVVTECGYYESRDLDALLLLLLELSGGGRLAQHLGDDPAHLHVVPAKLGRWWLRSRAPPRCTCERGMCPPSRVHTSPSPVNAGSGRRAHLAERSITLSRSMPWPRAHTMTPRRVQSWMWFFSRCGHAPSRSTMPSLTP